EGSAVRALSRPVLTRRILSRLKARGLIGSTPRLVGGPGGGSAHLAYSLTESGRLIAGVREDGLPARFRGTLFVPHALMSAEAALAFRRAARANREHELIEWQSDWQVAERLGPSPVVPDGHLIYATAMCEINAFVE